MEVDEGLITDARKKGGTREERERREKIEGAEEKREESHDKVRNSLEVWSPPAANESDLLGLSFHP